MSSATAPPPKNRSTSENSDWCTLRNSRPSTLNRSRSERPRPTLACDAPSPGRNDVTTTSRKWNVCGAYTRRMKFGERMPPGSVNDCVNARSSGNTLASRNAVGKNSSQT